MKFACLIRMILIELLLARYCLYISNNSCLTLYSQFGELTQSFPKIHGKAGVTSVCCHGNQVYTTGRDGQYRVYAWQEDGSLKLLNSNRVCNC